MSSFPPDGWSVEAGVWGTDMDQDNTYVRNGAYSVHFKNTGSAALLIADYVPVEPSAVYDIGAWLAGQNATSNFRIGCYWYTKTKSIISNTILLTTNLGPVYSAYSWKKINAITTSPATAAFARPYFGRTSTFWNLFGGWCGLIKKPLAFSSYLSGNQSISNSGFTKIGYNAEIYDYGSHFSTSTGQFTAPYDMLLHVDAHALIDNLADTNYLLISVYKNGTEHKRGILDRTSVVGSSTGYACVSADVECALGDIIDIRANQNASGSRNLLGTSSIFNFFNGHEIVTTDRLVR